MKDGAFLDNQTGLPTRTMRSAVRWVLRELGVDLPSLVVRVLPTTASSHHGRFYPNARRRPRVWARGTEKVPIRTNHLIVNFVPLSPNGDHDRGLKGGPPPLDPENWIESLICITAHEATHARQYLFPKPGSPRWSEVEAEWSEYRLLKRWRERSN